MGNAERNAGIGSGIIPYAVAAAVVIVAVALFFMAAPPAPQNVPPPLSQPSPDSGSASGQPVPPQVSGRMSAESCNFVYGTVMENSCSGGLFPLGEVQSTDGTRRFCCGKSINLGKRAESPLPVVPPEECPPNASSDAASQAQMPGSD